MLFWQKVLSNFQLQCLFGAPSLKANKFTESPETYSQYTIEVRFQVANTADRDRAVFKNGGDDANFILLRFEDLKVTMKIISTFISTDCRT